MADVFISYARAQAESAERIAGLLDGHGYRVWRDDQLPVHRAYSEVIEERLRASDAVLVLWSTEAARSQWVRAEAEVARAAGTLVQASLDRSLPPLPFNQIQCADLAGWDGGPDHSGWRKVVASIADLAGEARAAPGVPPAARAARARDTGEPSIAVLPLAADGEDEQRFADGMVEEIVAALARFPALTVIGSGSSLAYRGDPRQPSEIARELGVKFLLAGGIRRSGERVRIAVNLGEAASGRQLWAERFDVRLEDVFELQDKVATAAAAQIIPAIEAAYARQSFARPTSDLSAYELYLRATRLERDFTREAIKEAITLLDLAIVRDPNFAVALASCCQMHALLVLNGWADDPDMSVRAALELGRKAVATGTDDPEVLSYVCTALIWVGGDAKTADALAERALALNPGASLPWFASAWIKAFDGRHDLAMEHWRRHMALDPRSPLYAFVAGGVGIALTLSGRSEEGVTRLTEALHLVPGQRIFRAILAAALAHAGRATEARIAYAALPPGVLDNTLALLRAPVDRELIRQGLDLAGAAV
jgi:adenylate cyclase